MKHFLLVILSLCLVISVSNAKTYEEAYQSSNSSKIKEKELYSLIRSIAQDIGYSFHEINEYNDSYDLYISMKCSKNPSSECIKKATRNATLVTGVSLKKLLHESALRNQNLLTYLKIAYSLGYTSEWEKLSGIIERAKREKRAFKKAFTGKNKRYSKYYDRVVEFYQNPKKSDSKNDFEKNFFQGLLPVFGYLADESIAFDMKYKKVLKNCHREGKSDQCHLHAKYSATIEAGISKEIMADHTARRAKIFGQALNDFGWFGEKSEMQIMCENTYYEKEEFSSQLKHYHIKFFDTVLNWCDKNGHKYQ